MKSKVGRKKAKIDWDKVDSFLIAGCHGTEIASYLGIHYETLYRRCDLEKKMRFSDYSQLKKAHGDALLKAAQFDEAIRKRDRGMLIWLGKNRLGQMDKETVVHKGNLPVEIVKFTDKIIEPWSENNGDTKADTN